MLRRHMRYLIRLLDWIVRWNLYTMGACFNHILQSIYFNIARTDFTSVNPPGRARVGKTVYYSDDAYCRLVTPALEL